MMRTFRHPVLALLVLATLVPTLAWGQGEKVGIVTTLEGNVTARRAVLPQPVPLKFKDDVFFRDTITTGDQSLARVLLGGKSIVTVRERSVVTITESPGRSYISLESGKIGLAVAREKLAPGESVDVRTPNAVVGVRGTVIVAETFKGATATSNIYFLRGSGECFVVDQQTGRPIGAPVTLKPLESFKVVGSAARVEPISASQVGQITAGLEGKGVQHKEAANRDQVKTQVAQATSAVLGALLGGPGGQAAVAGIIVPGAQQTQITSLNQLVVPTQNCVVTATETCGAPVAQAAPASGGPTVPPAPAPAPAPSTVPSNITIDPALAQFAAASAAAPIPVVMIPAGVGPLTIPARGFQVETTTQIPANLDRPLFQATDANLTIGGNLLNVLGSLSSTSGLPLLSTDPTTITTGGDFIRIAPGASVSVNSSLVSDSGGTLTAGGSLISVEGGGSLTSTGASPLVQLNSTNVNVGRDFLRVGTEASASGASVNLSGSLLKMTNGALQIGSTNLIGNGGFENGFAGWTIFNQPGSSGDFRIQSGTTSPLSGFSVPAPPGGTFAAMSDQFGPGTHILYRDVTVPQGAPVLQFALFIGNRATLFATPNTLDFSGAANQQVRVDLVNRAAGIQDVESGVLRNLFQTQPGQPLVRGYEVFTVDLSDFAGQTVRLRFTEVDNQFFFQLGVDEVGLVAAASLLHRESIANLLHLDKSSITNTSPDPLVVASQAVVTTSGDLVALTRGAALTTSGPLISATASTIVPATGTVLSLSGGSTLTAGSVLSLAGGSRFATTKGPFASISGGSLTADTLIRTDGAGNIVNLTGGFLDLSNNADVTLGRIATNSCDCNPPDIFTHTLGMNQSVIKMSSSHLTLQGGESLVRFGVDRGTPVTQGGVALIATGTALARSMIEVNGIVLDLGGVKLTDPNPQLQLSQTTLSQTGFNSLIEVFGLPVTAAGPLLNARAGSTIEVVRERLLDVQGPFTVNGPGVGALLQFADSTVKTGSEIVFVGTGGRLTLDRGLIDAVNTKFSTSTFDTFFTVARGSGVTASTTAPFIRLNSSTVKMLLGEDFIHVGLGDGTRRASLTLDGGGPLVKLEAISPVLTARALLRVTGSDVSAEGPLLDMVNANLSLGAVLRTEMRSTIITTAGPVIKISGGSLTADVLASTDGARNLLNLTGPVLDLTNTNVTLRRVSDEPAGSTDIFALTLARNTPVIRMEGSTLTMTGLDANLIEFDNDLPARTTAGTALIATGRNTVNLSGSLLRIRDVTGMATAPLVQLMNTTINQTLTAKPLIFVESNRGTTTLTGQLLIAADSVIGTSGSFARFTNGALIDNATTPLVSLNRGQVTSAGNFMLFDSAFTLDLSGPLLRVVGSMLSNGDPATNPRSFIGIFDSSSVKSSTANALVDLDTSSVVTSGSFVSLRRSGPTPSMVDLAGSLLKATGGSITPFSTALKDASGVPILCCDLLTIGQSATLTSRTTDALVQLDHVSIPNANRIVAVFDVASIAGEPVGGSPAHVTLAGPLISATGGTINALQELVGVFRSSLTSTTAAPLIQLADITVALGGASPFGGATTTGRLFSTSASASVPASVNLAGPLFSASNAIITTTDDTFGVFNGATLRATTASPLISVSGGSVTAAEAGNFFVVASGVGLPPSVSLAGPLLSAANTTVTNGDPRTSTNSFVFIGDSGTLASTTGAPLLMFDHAVVDTSGNVFTARRSNSTAAPTMVTLGGPLLSAVSSSFNTSSRGLGSPCCSGFFVGEAARFESKTPLPLIDLTNSTFNAGPDVQSGGSFFTVADASGVPGVIAPATVMLAGPLLKVSNSIVSALFNLLTVTRSSLSSKTEASLVQLGTGSSLILGGANPFAGSATTIGRALSVVSSTDPGTVAPFPSSVVLKGPFLQATNSNLTITGDVIGVFNGATVTSATHSPFVDLNNTALTLGVPGVIAGHVVQVEGTGGITGTSPASLDLQGPLLSATNATNGRALTVTGALTNIFSGGQVSVTNSTDPFVSITGGSHSLATNSGAALFSIGPGGRLSLSGGLLALSNVTIPNSGQLLQASAGVITTGGPLLAADGGSLTSVTPNPFINIGPNSITSPEQVIRLANNFSLGLKGSLLSATDVIFTTPSTQFSFFAVVDGASVTTTATGGPLLQFTGTGTLPDGSNKSKVTAARNFLPLAINTASSAPPSMTLSGPLLNAVRTDFKTGDPRANTFTFLFVGDSAALTGPVASEGDAPSLVTFDRSSLSSAGDFLTVRRSKDPTTTPNPSRVILDGPLLVAANSSFTTFSNAHPSGQCCSFVFVGEGGQLKGTGTTALLQFTNSVFPNVGGSFVNVADSAGLADSVSRPALVSLKGPLLQDFGGQYTINGAVVRIRNGSEVSSTSPNPLLSFSTSMVAAPLNGNMSLLNQGSINAAANGGFDPGDPRNTTLLSLAGGLASATDSIFNTGTLSTFVGVRDGATVTNIDSTSFVPLINLTRSQVTVSGTFFTASQFTTDSNNNPITGSRAPIKVDLKGPLLSAQASDITAVFGLVSVGANATLVTNPSGTQYPLVSLDGGNLNVGTASLPAHVFNLVGRPEVDPVTGQPTGLFVDQPIQHGGAGALFETSNGATVNVSGSIHKQVDSQLLAATIPALINLASGSQVTTGSHAVDLGINGKVEVSDLIRLTNSTMTVGNGMNLAHLVKVNASPLKVAGSLVTLANNTGAVVGSTLNILNGALLNLINGAVVNIGGSLVSFVGANNAINVRNTFVPTTFVGGIPIFVQANVTFNSSITGAPLAGLNQQNNVITINGTALPTNANASSGVTGSLITVQNTNGTGAGGTLKIGK